MNKKIIIIISILFLNVFCVSAESIDLEYEIDLIINDTGGNNSGHMYLFNKELGLDYDTEIKNKETNIDIDITKNVSCQYDDDFEQVFTKISGLQGNVGNLSSDFEELNSESNYYDKYLNCSSKVATMAEYRKNNENYKTELGSCRTELQSKTQQVTDLDSDYQSCVNEKQIIEQNNDNEKDKATRWMWIALALGAGGLIAFWKKEKIMSNFSQNLSEKDEIGYSEPSGNTEEI